MSSRKSDPALSTLLDVRAAAFNRLSACAVALDKRGVIIDTNESWRLFSRLNEGDGATTGHGVSYLDVCDRSAASGAEGAAEVATGIRQILTGRRDRYELEYPCPSPVEVRWFMLQASSAPIAGACGAVLLHTDITAQKLLTEELTAAAQVDELTGLPNRRCAVRHLGNEIAAASISGVPVRVLFVDLDGFKAVNETHGHYVGDELLAKVAVRARGVVREHDRICRLGGDEFVVICAGIGEQQALLLAHRLRTVMAAPFQVGDRELSGGVSVGIAVSDASSTVEHLIDAAEAAMYDDKRGAFRRRELGRQPARPSSSIPWPTESVPVPILASAPTPERIGDQYASVLTGLQARADAAFAHSRDLVLFFALDGTVLSASPASRDMFGVEPADLIGLNSLNLIHPDDQERVFLAFASIANLGETLRTEFRVIDGAGTTRWLEEIATNLVDDPNVGCFVGNLRDVTERVELLQRIEADRSRLDSAQQSARLGSFEVDMDTGIVRRSDELWRMLGLEPGPDTVGGLAFLHAEDQQRFARVFADVCAGKGPAESVCRLMRADGEARWVRAEVSRSGSASGAVVIGTVVDITDRHEADLALAFQATHDWLTELRNLPSLHQGLDAALESACASRRVAVALIDLDDFKVVNDRHGHAMGDEVLRAFANRLVGALPANDLVARFDSDKFAIVRTDVSSHADARRLGETVLSLLRDPLTTGPSSAQITMTASVGVALSTATDSAASLVRDADDALYHAKHNGKDCLTVFDASARARVQRRRTLVAALPLALDRDEFRVEYQPVVDLTSLTTVGFEALIRWDHPDLGPVSPAEFIPLAETHGEIVRIGDWVLDRASRQLATWRADSRSPSDLWMAVNVSANQLAQRDLADRLLSAVLLAGVPVTAIHLEITESVLMDRIENALLTVGSLRDAGFRLSIDDFGTGYSSLSYLSRMPIDTLKVDQSFVAGLTASGPAPSIVRTIVALAEALDLSTVAEGIESSVQLEYLRQLGCEFGQGYLWSAPLPPDDAFAWMVARHPSALLTPISI